MKKVQQNSYKTILLVITLLLFGTITFKGDVGNSKTTDIKAQIVEPTNKIVAVADSTEGLITKTQQKRQVTLSRGGEVTVKPRSERDLINGYVREVCSRYKIDPEMVMSMIVSESNYNPRETTGICLGLMQISTRWHGDRARRLGVTDFYDPYGNILLGVDYLSELFKQYKDPRLVLMLYNMNHDDALRMYRNGQISTYAKTVLARAEQFKKGE